MRARPGAAAARHFLLLACCLVPSAFLRIIASFYLLTDLHAWPWQAGAYTYAVTFIGLGTSLLASRGFIDRHDPRVLVASCLALATTTFLLLLAARFGLVLLVPAAMAGGLSQVLLPCLFAFDQRHRPTAGHGQSSVYGTRGVLSGVWIVGPPLAYLIYSARGFAGVLCTALAFVALSLVGVLATGRGGVAPGARAAREATGPAASRAAPPIGAPAVLAVILLVQAANMVHQVSLPLMLTGPLHGALSAPGLGMGLAAASEVAVIVAIPRLLRHVSEVTLLVTGLLVGLAYFAALSVMTSPVLVVLAQGVYGAHFALSSIVALGVLQRLSTRQVGSVAAQFTVAAGTGDLTGSALFALLAGPIGYRALATGTCLGIVGLATATALAGLGTGRRWSVRR